MREWLSLRDDALISEDTTAERTVAVFKRSDEVMSRLEALIDAEKDCCSFLRFKVTAEDGRITVEIRGSTDTGPAPTERPGLGSPPTPAA